MIEEMIRKSIQSKRDLDRTAFPPGEIRRLRERVEAELNQLLVDVDDRKEILREIRRLCNHAGVDPRASECPICGDSLD